MSITKKLFICKEYYHHHAFEILNSHSSTKDLFLESFNTEIELEERIKKTKSKESEAVKADDLNKQIRRILSRNNNFKFEVSEEYGVFYFSSQKSSIGGFDFAIINHRENLIKLRNLCFGEIQYFDNITRWNKFIDKNPDLAEIAADIVDSDVTGKNLIVKKNQLLPPLILGEIQFGNWALAYRDFFKVLKANVQNSVDCLVYVVPTGKLEKKLSDGIVTFDKTYKILKEFEKVINVPVWLIGIDIDD